MNHRNLLAISAFSLLATLATHAQEWDIKNDPEQQKIIAAYKKSVPTDKNLDPAWVKSLTERESERPAYTTAKDQLKYIGMPVGGMMAGTVYLGGDGKLWLWEIFNRQFAGVNPRLAEYKGDGGGWFGYQKKIAPNDGARYVDPLLQESSFEQGFALRIKDANGETTRSLDQNGFKDITFQGSYPLANIHYSDPASPVKAQLTAYTPFIPLDAEDSSLPATILEYTVTNTSSAEVSGDIFGWTQNPAFTDTRKLDPNFKIPLKTNQLKKSNYAILQQCSDLPNTPAPGTPIGDLSKPYATTAADFATNPSYWLAEGDAFGKNPVGGKAIGTLEDTKIAPQRSFMFNSSVKQKDDKGPAAEKRTGKLTSKDFTIEKSYIRFNISGGKNDTNLYIALIVDGQPVRKTTGNNNPVIKSYPIVWNLNDLKGKTAHIEIVDNNSDNSNASIAIENLETADAPVDIPNAGDNGDLSLALLKPAANGEIFFNDGISVPKEDLAAKSPAIGSTFTLKPGESKTITFAYTWYFPNLYLRFYTNNLGRSYQTKFKDSTAVADYLAANYEKLSNDTKLWINTWEDSTLPYWFLDRSLIALDTMATENVYRFKNGQVWGWEGVGVCNGLCSHVWFYAQSLPRLFPELSQNIDQRTYFGISMLKDGPQAGGIKYRMEGSPVAVDGQASIIMEAYREHLMSANDTFLKTNWPQIKVAMQYMIKQDAADGQTDGMLQGEQNNTLDAAWFGKVPTIATLYLGSLRACEEMATIMGDKEFATECHDIFTKGQESIKPLFRPEVGYYVQIEDGKHKDKMGTGVGCYIDQVLGQWWAYQLNLGEIIDNKNVKTSLDSIWKYNFIPNIGEFRSSPDFKAGRAYAMGDEKGTIMCSWPDGGLRPEFKKGWQFGYFNECMTGFEHDFAAHLIYEGKVEQGLAAFRAIHDRYAPEKRNPFNEIECSDHYARAMASYSVYLAISGYQYNGPKGEMAFNPRLTPENFRCAFVAAEGWGTYSQKISANTLTATLTVKHGSLNLSEVALTLPGNKTATKATVKLGDESITATVTAKNGQSAVKLGSPVIIKENQTLTLTLE